MLSSKDTLSCKDNSRFKVKEQKMILQANNIHGKAGIVILISDKIDFKIINVTRYKDGHFMVIKGTLHHKDITLLNIYSPNQGAPKYIKQLLTELKGETDHNTT